MSKLCGRVTICGTLWASNRRGAEFLQNSASRVAGPHLDMDMLMSRGVRWTLACSVNRILKHFNTALIDNSGAIAVVVESMSREADVVRRTPGSLSRGSLSWGPFQRFYQLFDWQILGESFESPTGVFQAQFRSVGKMWFRSFFRSNWADLSLYAIYCPVLWMSHRLGNVCKVRARVCSPTFLVVSACR